MLDLGTDLRYVKVRQGEEKLILAEARRQQKLQSDSFNRAQTGYTQVEKLLDQLLAEGRQADGRNEPSRGRSRSRRVDYWG